MKTIKRNAIQQAFDTYKFIRADLADGLIYGVDEKAAKKAGKAFAKFIGVEYSPPKEAITNNREFVNYIYNTYIKDLSKKQIKKLAREVEIK